MKIEYIKLLMYKHYLNKNIDLTIKKVNTTFKYGIHILKGCDIINFYFNTSDYITNSVKVSLKDIKTKDLEKYCDWYKNYDVYKAKIDDEFEEAIINKINEIGKEKFWNEYLANIFYLEYFNE